MDIESRALLRENSVIRVSKRVNDSMWTRIQRRTGVKYIGEEEA